MGRNCFRKTDAGYRSSVHCDWEQDQSWVGFGSKCEFPEQMNLGSTVFHCQCESCFIRKEFVKADSEFWL